MSKTEKKLTIDQLIEQRALSKKVFDRMEKLVGGFAIAIEDGKVKFLEHGQPVVEVEDDGDKIRDMIRKKVTSAAKNKYVDSGVQMRKRLKEEEDELSPKKEEKPDPKKKEPKSSSKSSGK